jgi:hypothetical protein
MIRWRRRLHTFLGVFFSPLLLLFVVTGWWQTVSPNRNKGLGFGTSWIEKLSTIHVDNYFPLPGARNYLNRPLQSFGSHHGHRTHIHNLAGARDGLSFCKKESLDNADIGGWRLGSDLSSLLGRGCKEGAQVTGDNSIRLT